MVRGVTWLSQPLLEAVAPIKSALQFHAAIVIDHDMGTT
jgi:hypothetical protein